MFQNNTGSSPHCRHTHMHFIFFLCILSPLSIISPSLPVLLLQRFPLLGQGRDGLDWHRLVLGGQREGRDKGLGLLYGMSRRV